MLARTLRGWEAKRHKITATHHPSTIIELLVGSTPGSRTQERLLLTWKNRTNTMTIWTGTFGSFDRGGQTTALAVLETAVGLCRRPPIRGVPDFNPLGPQETLPGCRTIPIAIYLRI